MRRFQSLPTQMYFVPNIGVLALCLGDRGVVENRDSNKHLAAINNSSTPRRLSLEYALERLLR